MKTPLVALLALASASAQTTPIEPLSPEAARLQIHTGEASPFLRVSNAGNHRWMLQSSTDLSHWTDGPSYRVFNGELNIPLPTIDGGELKKYYRLNSDLAGAVPSAAANALLLPAQPYDYAGFSTWPKHIKDLRPFAAEPNDNPTTNHGANLGRVLFYDKRLSLDQSVSCASCHQAEHGWSDPRQKSVGIGGVLTRRNSMGLTNLRFGSYDTLFWTLRASSIEQAALLPIQDPLEMGMSLEEVANRLSTEPFYAELFTSAFGTAEINSTRISRAIAQYLRSIVSTKSKWDIGVPSNFANFTAQEQQGRTIFEAKCGICHTNDHTFSLLPTNNGLEYPYVDKGLGEDNPGATRDGRFRLGTLRNIELTAPYMHDGRFGTLEEVVDFYNSGIINNPALHQLLKPFAKPVGMGLNAEQKAALVAFLKTLTDTSVTTDPKFSDPFRYTAE